MKKKIFITLTCVVALALLFVSQNKSLLNSIMTSNVEALTGGDPTIPFSITIESKTMYKWGAINPDNPLDNSFYAPIEEHTVPGKVLNEGDNGIIDWFIALFNRGIYPKNTYECTTDLAQIPSIYYCYKITVE